CYISNHQRPAGNDNLLLIRFTILAHMNRYWLILFICLIWHAGSVALGQPLRIIMIGAHPDDCEVGAGGTAFLYAQQGHAVKFVSMTNGDKGHQRMKGDALAKRRYNESMEAARRIGITYEVLNIP